MEFVYCCDSSKEYWEYIRCVWYLGFVIGLHGVSSVLIRVCPKYYESETKHKLN